MILISLIICLLHEGQKGKSCFNVIYTLEPCRSLDEDQAVVKSVKTDAETASEEHAKNIEAFNKRFAEWRTANIENFFALKIENNIRLLLGELGFFFPSHLCH